MRRYVVGVDRGDRASRGCAVYAHVDDNGHIFIDHVVYLDPATTRAERQLGSTADGALVPDEIFGPGERVKNFR